MMNQPRPVHAMPQETKLTVSYKAPASIDEFLQNLTDVVIVTDPHFIIKGFNHAAETFFELPASHFIGTYLEKTIKLKFRNISQKEVLVQLYNTGLWNGEIIFSRQSADFIFHTNISLLYDDKGSVNSIVLVNHNITEEERQIKDLALAESNYKILVQSLPVGVLLIDADGIICTANNKAAEIFGISEDQLPGRNIINPNWRSVREDGSIFPAEEFPAIVSMRTGEDRNEIVMGLSRPDGSRLWISINSRRIVKEENPLTYAVVVSFKDISKEKYAAEKLKESELLFRTFMTNSSSLAWIYDDKGNFVYGNPLFLETIGSGYELAGKNIHDFSPANIAAAVLERNNEVLRKGEPVITEDELTLADGTKRYFVSNWFLISANGQKLIAGQAIDITERKNAEKQIALMHERFGYVVNASSDAIWDLDLTTNEIYRSDAFSKISGYSKEDIQSSLEWWFDKIHPDDKERVNKKIENQLTNGITNWEDEYRFQHADGSYRYIYDKGFAIYENNEPVRQIGSMQDITERKNLEAKLLQEQVQKQKLINQATISAQEEERNMISGELHDNVNQLLISARLYIGVAKNKAGNQDELLDKATAYLLMAVDEIRALSKRMNSKVVSYVGLSESIQEIAYTMQELNKIEIETDIDKTIISRLTAEQQLMVFRIVQEQVGNIIKHASATNALILLKQHDNNINLVISDNGQGFDKDEQKLNGVGYINIFNRVDAYNGKAEIISSPGNGCMLNISFPFAA